LERVTATTSGTSGVQSRERVEYRYNASGIRMIAIDSVDSNLATADFDSQLTGRVEYLIEQSNPTGYAQTVIETKYNSNNQATERTSFTFGTDELTQTKSTLDPSSGAVLATATHTFGHDGHGSVRSLFDANTTASIVQFFTYTAFGEMLSLHNAMATLGTQASALTSLQYNGESIDSRTGLYNFRARWYSTSSGRFDRYDPFAGNPNDPFSFNKFGFVHGDPIGGVDPSGNWTITIQLSTVSISVNVGRFFAASAASYVLGKAIEATFLLAVDGDLSNFRWFSAWDLLAFVPGGAIAGAFAKIIRYPTSLLTRHGGEIVGKLFANGTTSKLSAYFAKKFPNGWSVWRPGINGGTTFTISPGKFQHIIERHLPQFYDGTRQLASQVTGFWPVGSSADDVLLMLKDAMFRCTKVAGTNAIQQDVLLSNGIVARLATNSAGEVITFFPKSGPGVTTVQEIIEKGLL
jgi:RHS repeat-associated protein